MQEAANLNSNRDRYRLKKVAPPSKRLNGSPKKRIPIKLGLNQNIFEDWQCGDRYTLDKIIGQGSYGNVASAIDQQTGQKVAIKKFQNIFKDNLHCKRALREISILRQCQHPCVVKLIDIVLPNSELTFTDLYLVLEYAESDLRKLYKSGTHLQMVHIKTITYNLLLALKFLHKSKVIHRDIKPANVLLNEDCSVKLCDYGLSRCTNGIDRQNLDLILGPIKQIRTPIVNNIKTKNLGMMFPEIRGL